MTKRKYKYYLKAFYEETWKEVSLEAFCRAERFAGFRNKGGGPTATAAFSGSGLEGHIELIEEGEER